MPIVLGPVSTGRLAQMASLASALPYSYPEVGRTRDSCPPGYRPDRRSVDLGSGVSAFERAIEGLRRWESQRGAGARVAPPDAGIVAGQTVVVALAFGPLTMVAPCRIVYVDDEPDRFGFAYGSLAGHPEQGEESFHVIRQGTRVRFEIAAFSRPAHPLARLGHPVARCLQTRIVGRYLQGIRAFVESAG
ncbi:MAG: DUF1990 domain-containing protein [Acidimicrobiia bacterium]